jgi:glucose/mannose-6-phosphate isomerase
MSAKNPITSILDSREEIQKLDPDGALNSAELLADQIQQVWAEREQLDFSSLDLKGLKNIVIAGMGGSALGADVIKNLFKDQLPLPLTINRSYSLPAFVNENSLVILSSYSGNTEEIISCSSEAAAKGAQIVVLCAGGKLKKLAKEKNYPHFIINPKHNPSGQPRMAVGYSIMALISIFERAQLIKFDDQNVSEIVDAINRATEDCRLDIPQDKNKAKLIAFMALERRPILVGAEFLEGAIHTVTNQFNENAKSFADYKVIPELNHHLLEGLQFPKSNPMNHLFLFFQSELYHPRNQKRIELTQNLVEEKGLETLEIKLETENKLMQVFEVLTIGTFANLYLAYLEKINPCPIPSVDWFKDQLKK